MFSVSCNNSSVSKNPKNNTPNPNPNYKPPIGRISKMSKIYCDRCGKVIKQKEEYEYLVKVCELKENPDNEVFELCADCVRKLTKFLEGAELNNEL